MNPGEQQIIVTSEYRVNLFDRESIVDHAAHQVEIVSWLVVVNVIFKLEKKLVGIQVLGIGCGIVLALEQVEDIMRYDLWYCSTG